jgi:hypothetical protein
MRDSCCMTEPPEVHTELGNLACCRREAGRRPWAGGLDCVDALHGAGLQPSGFGDLESGDLESGGLESGGLDEGQLVACEVLAGRRGAGRVRAGSA